MAALPPSRWSVLIVEDDPALRAMYRSILRAAGYTVVAVEDGADALRVIEYRHPHAIVLDLALPRLSGRDVHRELSARADTCHIPVVVVSGTDTSDLDPSDFAAMLTKPVEPEVLVRVVDTSIRRSRSRFAEFT